MFNNKVILKMSKNRPSKFLMSNVATIIPATTTIETIFAEVNSQFCLENRKNENKSFPISGFHYPIFGQLTW